LFKAQVRPGGQMRE